MPAKAVKIETHPVNLRMRNDTRALIDRAAEIRGKNRSEFMIEAAVAAAQETLLDQTLVLVDRETYDFFLRVLDQPPSGEGFERLMSRTPPWLEE
ncbi:MAG: type II toxin-antitoxin system TacA family antitoxin [Devosia sp.]